MAERRMFAKSIIDSDLFLDMPASSRLLYYDLSMRADDDGFVNSPKKIMRITGASDDDLRVLASKNFIIPFESGVVVIKHWRIHNYIRGDRYSPTICQDEKGMLSIASTKEYVLEDGIPTVYQESYQRETQDRLGKDRLGKVRLGEGREEGLAAVIDAYRSRISATPSPSSMDELKGYVERMGPECCQKAIDAAVDAGARNWSYVRAILRDKEAQGVKSLEDWQRADDEHERRKKASQPVKKGQITSSDPAKFKSDLDWMDKFLEETEGNG